MLLIYRQLGNLICISIIIYIHSYLVEFTNIFVMCPF